MLFVQCIRNGTTSYSCHDGMSSDTVTALLTDLGCTDVAFIAEADYLAALAALQPQS